MTEQAILGAALVVLAWVGAGLITYGFMKAKISEFERRLELVEGDRDRFMPRIEFNGRHIDLVNRLDRIEQKIDGMVRS